MPRITSELLVRLIDGVTRPARQAAAAVRALNREGGEGGAAYAGRMRALAASNRKSLVAMRGQMVQTAAVAAAMVYAVRGPVKAAQAFEGTLTGIGQKANMSRAEATAFGREIRAIGPQVNQSAQALAEGADVLVGFGLAADQALDMMKPIGKAATAYGADMNDLAQAGYAAVNNLKIPASETALALDIMAQAGKEGAFEVKEMAQYMPSLAASAQALGQTGPSALADLAAALQVVRDGTGDSASAATNLENVLQKIYAPATERRFKEMGVDLRSAMKALEAEGKTPIEAIAELTRKATGGDLSKIGYLFEDAQVQKGLRSVIQGMEKYRAIREKAAGAKGVVDADYVERMKDSAAKTQAFAHGLENLRLNLGMALLPLLAAVSAALLPMINGMADWIDAHPKLTAAIVGTVAALVGLRLVTMAARMGFLMAKGGLFDLARGLGPIRGLVRGAGRLFWGFARNLLGVRGAVSTTVGALRLLRVAFIGTGIGAILVGIGLAAVWVINHWKELSAFFRGFAAGFGEAVKPIMPILQPVIDLVKAAVGWIGKLFAPSDGKGVKDWEDFGRKVGKIVGGIVNLIVGAIDKIKELGAFLIKYSPAGLAWQAGQLIVQHANKPREGRARGGHVRAGQDYLVGEERPEIFRPGSSGTIVPRVPAGGGGGRGGGPVTFNFHMPMTVNGAVDPVGFARRAGRAMEAEARKAMRALNADYGVEFG